MVILIPALSEVSVATIPVEPLTELIASFNAVKSLTDVIVAVTVEAVELLPCKVKVYVVDDAAPANAAVNRAL